MKNIEYIIYIIIFTLIVLSSLTLILLISKKSNLIPPLKKFSKGEKRKLIISILLSTLTISTIGDYYCISFLASANKEIIHIDRPSAGEGDAVMTIVTDSDIYSGNIDLEIQHKELSFDDTMALFQKYRKELDDTVLKDNTSFLMVSSPLSFPSSIGEENISISWYISDTNIMDYDGTLYSDNISDNGSEIELIATLKLGQYQADICYTVMVYKEFLSPKEKLSSKINEIINSEENLHKDIVSLPSEIDGISIIFYEGKTELPSWDICYSDNYCSPTFDCS